MDTVMQDIRYGARQLWRSPAFTVAALATLALGIGANTALFTLGNAIIAKPLPGIGESERLVWVMSARRGGQPTQMSYPDFQDYRTGLSGLVDLAAVSDGNFSLSSRGDPERARGQIVSGNFFSVLRVVLPVRPARCQKPYAARVAAWTPISRCSTFIAWRRSSGSSSPIA